LSANLFHNIISSEAPSFSGLPRYFTVPLKEPPDDYHGGREK
jgi:hypothetical protein